jgi:hypothetical protein
VNESGVVCRRQGIDDLRGVVEDAIGRQSTGWINAESGVPSTYSMTRNSVSPLRPSS